MWLWAVVIAIVIAVARRGRRRPVQRPGAAQQLPADPGHEGDLTTGGIIAAPRPRGRAARRRARRPGRHAVPPQGRPHRPRRLTSRTGPDPPTGSRGHGPGDAGDVPGCRAPRRPGGGRLRAVAGRRPAPAGRRTDRCVVARRGCRGRVDLPVAPRRAPRAAPRRRARHPRGEPRRRAPAGARRRLRRRQPRRGRDHHAAARPRPGAAARGAAGRRRAAGGRRHVRGRRRRRSGLRRRRRPGRGAAAGDRRQRARLAPHRRGADRPGRGAVAPAHGGPGRRPRAPGAGAPGRGLHRGGVRAGADAAAGLPAARRRWRGARCGAARGPRPSTCCSSGWCRPC